MVTRKDVAEVKEETRRRVLAAMEELGYQPNLVARSLKTKKSNQLAVLTNYFGDPFESGVLLHIEAAARMKGYTVFFQPYITEQEDQLKSQFMGRIDGLILLGQSLKPTTVEYFRRINIPSQNHPISGGCVEYFGNVPIAMRTGLTSLTSFEGAKKRRVASRTDSLVL